MLSENQNNTDEKIVKGRSKYTALNYTHISVFLNLT